MDLQKAKFWIPKNNAVKCVLCPNNCILKDGQTGPCNTRINHNNILYTLAYNNPSAVHIDPIEKKPLFHFKPGHSTFSLATNGCVLHCANCQNNSISQCKPTEPGTASNSPENIVRLALKYECESLSLTYTDPIAFYEYGLDIAKTAHNEKLPLVYISSGYINQEPLKEITPYLSAANIDLKCFNDKTYKLFYKGKLQAVLDTILYLHVQKVNLEITVLIIPGINDDEEEIKQMCDWLTENKLEQVPLHFSRFYPANKLPSKDPTPLTSLETAKHLAKEAGIKYIYIGNTRLADHNTTYCPECHKALILRHHLSLADNKLKAGTCPTCKTPIPGIW